MATKTEIRKEVAMVTNLAYIAADILECASADMIESMKNAGMEMKHEKKVQWNRMMNCCHQVSKEIGYLDTEIQMDFGNDADCMWQFMKVLLSRCGTDYFKLYEFYQYVKSHPAKMVYPNQERDEQRAFSFLFNKIKY